MNTQNASSNGAIPLVGPELNALEVQPTNPASLDQFESIVDRAHKEIEWVHSAYTMYARILGVILVTGIGCATYLTYNTIREMRSDMNDRVSELCDRVNKRVDAELSTESIQNLIREKAVERVDNVAGMVINNYVTRTLTPKLDTLEVKLNGFDARMTSLEKLLDAKISATEAKLKTVESGALAELRQTSEYVMTVVAAQNDDRKAYDQLTKWANDKASPFSERAAQARVTILNEHASPWTLTGLKVPWKPDVDPSKVSFGALKSDFRAAGSQIRIGLLEYIWSRPDIPKRDKMEFLVEVMRTDHSLQVVERAGRFFLTESKQQLKPLAIDQMVDWWEKHKGEYSMEDQSKESPARK